MTGALRKDILWHVLDSKHSSILESGLGGPTRTVVGAVIYSLYIEPRDGTTIHNVDGGSYVIWFWDGLPYGTLTGPSGEG